jgi:Holliday junction resolvase
VEKTVQKTILNYLDSIGAYTVKTITTNKKGTPDILACLNGRFIAIEVKDKGKLRNVTKLQQYNIDDINAKGGLAFVADSVDMVKQYLGDVE